MSDAAEYVYDPYAEPLSIWIAGQHYGGTSAVAAAVEALGIDLGQCDGPNDSHIFGNKEDREFLAWALTVCRGNDADPAQIIDGEDLEWLKELVQERDERGRPWGVKLPLLSYYAPLGMVYAARPKFIVVRRGLRPMSASYSDKENVPLDFAEDIWWRFFEAAHESEVWARRHGIPCMRIWYEDLTGSNDVIRERELDRLRDFVESREPVHQAGAVVLPTERHY